MENTRRLMTVAALCETTPWVREGTLRKLIRNRVRNGLVECGALKRIPGTRRWLIDLDLFLAWIDRQNKKSA